MRDYAARKTAELGEDYYRAHHRRHRTRVERYCVDCNERVWPGVGIETRDRCAPCSKVEERRKARRERIARLLERAAAGIVGKTTWTAGPCVVCGKDFVAQRAHVLTCSASCSAKRRRANRLDSRAARRAAGTKRRRVVRLDIYKRDGWRCQICRKMVKRDAAVPHPLAPVLDHILPLAAGGVHENANVQLAHFICNSRKRELPANDQLRLVG